MSARQCPKCGLFNTESADHCDCGYDFETRTAGKPKGGRRILETRVTCAACGNVWHYGKTEELEFAGAALQNVGKSMMCCTGCGPAIFIPNAQAVDLTKCQKCGSRAITKEIVAHDVP